ncbi:hypothetical protein FKM82_016889 [Ascaphus truei]
MCCDTTYQSLLLLNVTVRNYKLSLIQLRLHGRIPALGGPLQPTSPHSHRQCLLLVSALGAYVSSLAPSLAIMRSGGPCRGQGAVHSCGTSTRVSPSTPICRQPNAVALS